VANRPNIIDKNKDRTCLLTDEAISDRNVIQKEAENKLKYKSLKYRNSVNVEDKMLCPTRNYWDQRNCQ
jgi:hypothetical protein